MKNIFTTFSLFFCITIIYAQTPNFISGKIIGGNSGTTEVYQCYIDKEGNTYFMGVFYDCTGDFGNGITLPPRNVATPFFVKFNSSGTCLWARNITGFKIGNNNIAVDKEGNIYLAGPFWAGLDVFGLGIFPKTPDHQTAHYSLIKFDPNGNALWFKPIFCKKDTNNGSNINGVYMYGQNISIRLDMDENLLVTACYGTDISLVNGNDTIVIPADSVGLNNLNTFGITFDKNGNYINHISLGVQLTNVSPFMAMQKFEFIQTDEYGNIFRFITQLKKLLKYDSQGNLLVTKNISAYGVYPQGTSQGYLGCIMEGMTVDPNGNIYLNGYIRGSNSSVSHSYHIEGFKFYKYGDWNSTDAWLLKLSADSLKGEWLRQSKYYYDDRFSYSTTDHLGNMYVAGQYTNMSEGYVQLRKYNTDGNLLWNKILQTGTSATSYESGVEACFIYIADNGGNIMFGGWVKGRIQFDNSQPVIEFPNITKMWFAEYGTCAATEKPNIVIADTAFCSGDSLLLTAQGGGGSSYLWNFGDTTQSIYAHLPAMYSVVSVVDSQCYGQSAPVWIKEFPQPQIQVSTTDSIVCAGEEITLTASGANNYSWSNGIINAIPFVPENTGIYTVIGEDANGCKDTADIQITVNALPSPPVITVNGSVLTSSEASGNQWFFNDEAIEGATQQTYIAPQNGNYYVIVSDSNLCESQSNTITINVGINDLSQNVSIGLYPNPTSGKIYFSTKVDVQLTNILGEVVLIERNTNKIDFSNQSQGVYIATFFDKTGNIIQINKILKQ